MGHPAEKPAAGAGYDGNVSYAAGLQVERAGYEARIAAAKADGDDAAVKKLEDRLGQVDAELARIGHPGEVVEEAVEAPAPEKATPAKKAAAKG